MSLILPQAKEGERVNEKVEEGKARGGKMRKENIKRRERGTER